MADCKRLFKKFRRKTSVLSQKFAEKLCAAHAVMPVKTGIQKSLKFLDSGSRHPGLLPGMTNEFCCEFSLERFKASPVQRFDKLRAGSEPSRRVEGEPGVFQGSNT